MGNRAAINLVCRDGNRRPLHFQCKYRRSVIDAVCGGHWKCGHQWLCQIVREDALKLWGKFHPCSPGHSGCRPKDPKG